MQPGSASAPLAALVLGTLVLGLAQTGCSVLASRLAACPSGAVVRTRAAEDGVEKYCAIVSESGAEQRHGPYESFWVDAEGQRSPQESGRYAFGLPTGCWERFFASGVRESNACYVEGKPHGLWEYFHEDGTPRSRGSYRGGDAHGDFVYAHPGGQVQSQGRMVDGRRDGEWTWHDEGGRLTQVDVYQDGLQVRHAVFLDGDPLPEDASLREFLRCPPDADLVSVEREGNAGLDVFCLRVLDANRSVPDGPYRELYWGGGLYRTGTYDEGRKTGLWLTFHPHGLIAEAGSYAEGIASGVWTRYSEGGWVVSETTYEHGRPHGPYRRWHANTALAIEGQNAQGSRQGLWTYFLPSGELDYVIEFEDGEFARSAEFEAGARVRCPAGAEPQQERKGDLHVLSCRRPTGDGSGALHGRYSSWRPNGLRHTVETLDQGVPHGAARRYHENGTLALEGSFERGERSGVWRSFGPDGELETLTDHQSTATYDSLALHPTGALERLSAVQDGKPHGPIVEWHPDGPPRLVGTFQRGQRVSCWTFFLPSGRAKEAVRYAPTGEAIETHPAQACSELGFELVADPATHEDSSPADDEVPTADTAPTPSDAPADVPTGTDEAEPADAAVDPAAPVSRDPRLRIEP